MRLGHPANVRRKRKITSWDDAINARRMYFGQVDVRDFDRHNYHAVAFKSALHEVGVQIAHAFDLCRVDSRFDNFHDPRAVAVTFVESCSVAMRLFEAQEFTFSTNALEDIRGVRVAGRKDPFRVRLTENRPRLISV